LTPEYGPSPYFVIRLDGATGQPVFTYTVADPAVDQKAVVVSGDMAVHTDGTIFVVVGVMPSNGPGEYSVIGIDSSGGQKFSVPLPSNSEPQEQSLMIAGDGYAYLPYAVDYQVYPPVKQLMLLRVNSEGASDNFPIQTVMGDWMTSSLGVGGSLITNGDAGVLLAWGASNVHSWEPPEVPPPDTSTYGMVLTTGAGATSLGSPGGMGFVPVLQAQDGSFIGQAGDDSGNEYMIGFDQGGNLRWSVPNYYPLMATADGGVIATADYVSATTFDQNGNATGQMANMPTQSWRGNVYQLGSVDRMSAPPIATALSLWANVGGSPSENGTAARPWHFALSFENAFTFTPDYPNVLSNLTTDISSKASLIKQVAVREFQDAYSGGGNNHPVMVLEGARGDVLVEVVNHQTLLNDAPDCGASNQNMANGNWSHQVDWALNILGAQYAYKVVINNAQDEGTVLAQRLDLIQAIGRGIGVSAAHETAHQFLMKCCAMDADPQTDLNARGTFNATGCDGSVDPSPWTGYWPAPVIPLHWEQPALDALGQCLNGGWRSFYGQPCHN
jgi:hypothetical protein